MEFEISSTNSISIVAALLAAIGPIYLLAVAWPLSRIDLREHRLPNRLVLPAFPITLLGQLGASTILSQWHSLGFGLVACLAALIIGVLANEYASLGMGDVKLIAAITLACAWYGPLNPLLAIFAAFVLAGAVVLGLLFIGRASLGNAVALGPYLLAGFAVTQMLTWSTYLGGFSPNFLM